MRLRVWWVALGLAIAVAPAKAQEQKTLGPCSPAIAGVSGNVAVTCLTSNQRIRIASFTGNIAADVPGLSKFMSSNSGQIIYLDAAYTDAYTDAYAAVPKALRRIPAVPIYDKDLRRIYVVNFVDCRNKLLAITYFYLCPIAGVKLPSKYLDVTEIYFKDLRVCRECCLYALRRLVLSWLLSYRIRWMLQYNTFGI